VLHVALPLALGAASYIVFRSPLWSTAPHALRDHFADVAWGWSLGGFVSVMWLDQKRSHRVAWTLAAALVAASYECLQNTHIVAGRFDRVDLVAQTLAVLVAALIVGGKTWTTSREAC
jgi:hypothetical protein